MRVLVIGSGGREHALAWKLAQSSRVSAVLVAPGNAGTAQVARNLPGVEDDVGAIVALARREAVDLVVVGPEAPIAMGAADALQEAGIRVFAPSRRAARLEASKVWAKAFMARHGIPTAPFYVSSQFDDAVALVRMMPTPVVIKASGLAAGKGVAIAHTVREAEEILRRMMVERAYRGAGDEVVLEACLEGREVSLLAFVDGRTAVPMPLACDYKRLEEGNRGPNTGGMGAYCPVPWVTPEVRREIDERIFQPTLAALEREGMDYRGVLYCGLMITDEGPWVLEYNVRFGDPETQVILPLLETDLAEVLVACAEGRLGEADVRWSEAAACGVVVTARGYPGAYARGLPLPEVPASDGVRVFHAGTGIAPAGGGFVSAGGRLLTIVGRGADLAQARRQAYAALDGHDLTPFHYRRDIGALEAVAAR